MIDLVRRRSVGAEVVHDGAHFRVFAPRPSRVDLVIEERGAMTRSVSLQREDDGHWSALVAGLRAGARYAFRLDDDTQLLPDPASRFQPAGPHAPSELIDPRSFAWTDGAWKGVTLHGQVVYELHIGTFTREGTYAAAARGLEALRDLGITVVELLPVAEFAGRFGWGYDGVDLYAPFHGYGRPDDLRAFVDRAHALGIGVILDVVYNHLGPSGNYLSRFSEGYFTKKYENEWGEAIDFESVPACRDYFVENAAYWIDELHFDGLRLDATQSIHDASETHVVAEIVERARAVAGARSILIVGENEPQHPKLVRPRERGGYGLDAVWNDDFHHSARVALTGRSEAYYSPTKGTPQELLSAVKWGYLFQGQHYAWQDQSRGKPGLDIAPERFVLYLQNHDQVANSASAERLHELTHASRLRAMTLLLLLAPGTPMLFQGQEYGASSPFGYFADHEPELARLVHRGRLEFLEQFPSIRDDAVKTMQPAPHDERAFERCKLDPSDLDKEKHRQLLALHRDLLRLRREDPIFSAQRSDDLFGAVLGADAFVLRFGTASGRDRLVLVNLGPDLDVATIAEPLLAPIEGSTWSRLFDTEDPRYGGTGRAPLGHVGLPRTPSGSACVLAPKETEEPR